MGVRLQGGSSSSAGPSATDGPPAIAGPAATAGPAGGTVPRVSGAGHVDADVPISIMDLVVPMRGQDSRYMRELVN
eukprot:3071658-Pyramimonas_sp.AAC.1